MLAAFITSPFGGALLGLESAHTGISYPRTLFPSLGASALAATAFVLLSGRFFGGMYAFAEYQSKLTDLLLAVPLGLVGALAVAIFIVSIAWPRKIMQPLKQHLIVRGLVGGLVLGVAGARCR
jgi:H+/Cl- antiporter ClcA